MKQETLQELKQEELSLQEIEISGGRISSHEWESLYQRIRDAQIRESFAFKQGKGAK